MIVDQSSALRGKVTWQSYTKTGILGIASDYHPLKPCLNDLNTAFEFSIAVAVYTKCIYHRKKE